MQIIETGHFWRQKERFLCESVAFREKPVNALHQLRKYTRTFADPNFLTVISATTLVLNSNGELRGVREADIFSLNYPCSMKAEAFNLTCDVRSEFPLLSVYSSECFRRKSLTYVRTHILC